MSQVSRFRLTNEVWDRLFNLFIDTLTDINGNEKLKEFIDSFFTPTEKIVFAKRLATAVMLSKENSYASIRKTLRVSPPTIARMSMRLKYEEKGLSEVVKKILQKDSTRLIWEEFTNLIDIPGKGRSLSEIQQLKKIRKERIHKLKREF